MDVYFELLDLIQKCYPEVECLIEVQPKELVKPVCRIPICDENIPFLVREFMVAGFDERGRAVYCTVPQDSRRFWK